MSRKTQEGANITFRAQTWSTNSWTSTVMPRGGPSYLPQEELHASSIEHPSLKDSDGNKCRWLLHTRRVPVLPTPSGASDSGMSQPVNASSLPICAGVGDPEAYVWACWDCVNDLCAKKPIMPSNGLTNDFLKASSMKKPKA